MIRRILSRMFRERSAPIAEIMAAAGAAALPEIIPNPGCVRSVKAGADLSAMIESTALNPALGPAKGEIRLIALCDLSIVRIDNTIWLLPKERVLNGYVLKLNNDGASNHDVTPIAGLTIAIPERVTRLHDNSAEWVG